MRGSHVICILACAVFGGAVAVPRQDEPKAEQQFKNIISFKGSKASDILPAMQFMSASLGVTCDYCHVEDRSSDEKGKKRTAREMIAMQRDINEKNFNGRNTVTCASCHGGRTKPLAVPPVEGTLIRARRSTEVKPEDVLAAYGKAVGGDASNLGEIELSGTTETHGQVSKLDANFSGEKFLFVIHSAKGDQKQAFNGALAWFTTPQGIQRVPLEYAIHFVRQSELYAGVDSLPKLPDPSVATARLGDSDTLIVNGTLADKTRISLYFDKKTGLLLRTLFGYPTVLGTLVQTNDYANYRRVGGVMIPMSTTNHSTEGDTVVKFSSARVQSRVDPASFDPPRK